MVARDITLSGLSFTNCSNTGPRIMVASAPGCGQVVIRGYLMTKAGHREWPGPNTPIVEAPMSRRKHKARTAPRRHGGPPNPPPPDLQGSPPAPPRRRPPPLAPPPRAGAPVAPPRAAAGGRAPRGPPPYSAPAEGAGADERQAPGGPRRHHQP